MLSICQCPTAERKGEERLFQMGESATGVSGRRTERVTLYTYLYHSVYASGVPGHVNPKTDVTISATFESYFPPHAFPATGTRLAQVVVLRRI
jgi:hypothetical protein